MLLLSYSITPISVIFSVPSQSMKKSITEPSYTCTVILIDVFVMKMELLEEISHIPCFSGFAADPYKKVHAIRVHMVINLFT